MRSTLVAAAMIGSTARVAAFASTRQRLRRVASSRHNLATLSRSVQRLYSAPVSNDVAASSALEAQIAGLGDDIRAMKAAAAGADEVAAKVAILKGLKAELAAASGATEAGPSAVVLPTNENSETLLKIRHTSAHVMAMAVQKLYPGVQCTIGPWIDNGFYYDFYRPDGQFAEEDLKLIKKEMDSIIKKKLPLVGNNVLERVCILLAKDETAQTYRSCNWVQHTSAVLA